MYLVLAGAGWAQTPRVTAAAAAAAATSTTCTVEYL